MGGWPPLDDDLRRPALAVSEQHGQDCAQHKRLWRYTVMSLDEIQTLPVCEVAAERAHCYLWCPNAVLPEGLETLRRWGFTYKGHLVWHKVRRDGQSDGRGVGFYFRNVTELVLFGVRGRGMRTLPPARSQVNFAGDAQARTLAQARRVAHDVRRTLLAGAVPGVVRPRPDRPVRAGTAWGCEADVGREEHTVHPMYRGGPVDRQQPELAFASA